MEITFPKKKQKIKLGSKAGVLYVLIGHGMSKDFWFMDFWGKPYMFRTYKEAVAGKKEIGKSMQFYKWEEKEPVIMKIQF